MGLTAAGLDYRDYTTLRLNDRLLEGADILRYCQEQGDAHFLDLKHFMEDWLQDRPEIQIMTSGSTGTPKTIRVRKNDMLWSASRTAGFFRFEEDQHALLALPLSYIAGKMMVVRAMYSGLNLILQAPSSQPLLEIPGDLSIDFAPLTPMQMGKLPARANLPKTILLGGGPISKKLEQTLDLLHTNVYHGYGMAETLSHIALRRVNGPHKSTDYKAFSDVLLRQDERGCLCIQLPYATEELVTNDIVALTSPNTFQWLGRADHVINTGGIKVFPEEIEAAIADLIPCRHFIAGVADEVLGEKVVLFIESTQPISSNARARLLDSLKKVLTNYQMPKEIFTVPAFVTTHSGKVQRLETIKRSIH